MNESSWSPLGTRILQKLILLLGGVREKPAGTTGRVRGRPGNEAFVGHGQRKAWERDFCWAWSEEGLGTRLLLGVVRGRPGNETFVGRGQRKAWEQGFFGRGQRKVWIRVYVLILI
jgi:hypothetical protein